MRRTLASSILCIAAIAFVPSSYGDFFVRVLNRGPVTYALSNVPPGEEGQLVDTTFEGRLLYGFGTGFTSLDQLQSSPDTLTFPTPGYYSGNESISDPPVPVTITLAVVAWETAGPYGETSYNFNPTTPVIQGASLMWTEEIPAHLPAGFIGVPTYCPLSFTVQIVPEPSSLALAGLSAATLMLLRRGK